MSQNVRMQAMRLKKPTKHSSLRFRKPNFYSRNYNIMGSIYFTYIPEPVIASMNTY